MERKIWERLEKKACTLPKTKEKMVNFITSNSKIVDFSEQQLTRNEQQIAIQTLAESIVDKNGIDKIRHTYIDTHNHFNICFCLGNTVSFINNTLEMHLILML